MDVRREAEFTALRLVRHAVGSGPDARRVEGIVCALIDRCAPGSGDEPSEEGAQAVTELVVALARLGAQALVHASCGPETAAHQLDGAALAFLWPQEEAA